MKLKEMWQNKTFRIIFLSVLALLLLLSVWKVFFSGEGKTTSYTPTEREARLSVLLGEIDGVQNATVMISEEEGSVKGAVVVFSGEDGILVRTRIMEAAARALGLSTRDILVYPAQS